jgi:hypothetical protein
MMPQPPQRPARMPSGPSPTIGGGVPNRGDRLRQQAEQTLPSMPPRRPMAGGAPPGGIAGLMGGAPRPPMGASAPMPSAPPPMGGGAPSMPPMGNAPMGMGMGMGMESEDGPGEQDLVTGIAVTANEIAGGNPRKAISMLDQAKNMLMQQLENEEGGGEADMDRIAAILGESGSMMG